ncbi:hypothetical protein KUCAC02_018183, partial [Chaenocephalus aceratus]
RKPYLISQNDMPVPIPMPLSAELAYYNAQRSPYPSDSNSIVPYGTFPRRDGYHTLQYKRGVLAHSGGMGANNINNDSPGRIRHLVHSVQKLFTKSHSLEGPHHTQSNKGANNGS